MSTEVFPGVTLVVGVFDLFHIGHLRCLQYVRFRSELLIVAVTSDSICHSLKQKKTCIQEDDRMEILRGLGWIDDVFLQPSSLADTKRAASWLASRQVRRVVLGDDWQYTAQHKKILTVLEPIGIELDFVPRTAGVSTTALIEKIKCS
ncbi:MAG: adenylyltransferase/cytidyltransferase family protein [Marinobacterium sp.]|nr:adenylyltransferase/cytidyltransferase family protein [Marinobacterium sp.]